MVAYAFTCCCVHVGGKKKNTKGAAHLINKAAVRCCLVGILSKFVLPGYIPEIFNITPSFFTKYFLNCTQEAVIRPHAVAISYGMS